MTPAPEKAAPIPADGLAFGDAVTNIAASDDNPIKHGWFIRRGRRSGRVNAGSFVEYATADGRLHQTPPDNIAPRDAEPVFRADRASQEERIREDERLRFEGDLDRWMKTLGAGITGYQPEAYAVMDAACVELVRARARIAALEAEASEGERRGLERAAEVADELASQWVIDASNAKTAEARAYFENRHSAASWVCDRIHALIPAPAREGE